MPDPTWLLGVPLAALVVEWVCLRWWVPPVFGVGFPLFVEPLPLPALPEEGEGQTAAVDWKVVDDGERVLWRGGGHRREGLTALRGQVRLRPSRRGVHLVPDWCPPWSALLAALALMGFGFARGTPHLTAPSAVLIVGGTALVYYQGAVRAVAELRFGLARSLEEGGEG